jgi:hypothetical protein
MATLIQDGDITFLYRLAEGITTKSYGPAVAKLAGVPEAIIEKALKISEQFERETGSRERSARANDAAVPLMLQSDSQWLSKGLSVPFPLVPADAWTVVQKGVSPADSFQFLATLSVLRRNIERLCAA